jgi:hypothetical protein
VAAVIPLCSVPGATSSWRKARTTGQRANSHRRLPRQPLPVLTARFRCFPFYRRKTVIRKNTGQTGSAPLCQAVLTFFEVAEAFGAKKKSKKKQNDRTKCELPKTRQFSLYFSFWIDLLPSSRQMGVSDRHSEPKKPCGKHIKMGL